MYRIEGLWRYPVKTLAGEPITEAALTADGVPGDRLVHVRGPEGVRTSRRHHRLLGLRGTLGPDGQALVNGLPWQSAEALALVRAAAGDDAWLAAYDGPARFDILPLLVATDGAVAAFGRDIRRLRPNILIGGVEGLAEVQWEDALLRVGVRLGWPERVPGTEFERDWSQALSFHADDLPLPVNTGWGGLRASIDSKQLSIGIAFRCGWTKQVGDVSGGTGGGFDVGYAVGGVVQFQYTFDAFVYETRPIRLLTYGIFAWVDEHERTVASAYAQSAIVALEALAMRGDIRLQGELFGDVWGSAWIKFMGVTLAAIELKAFARYRICGSLKHGITDCRASCGFSVSVTILCITYRTEARYDLILINGSCPMETLFTSEQLLQFSNMPAAQFPRQLTGMDGST